MAICILLDLQLASLVTFTDGSVESCNSQSTAILSSTDSVDSIDRDFGITPVLL